MSNGTSDINTRSQGIRKSKFPAKTTIDDGAFFDYFTSGNNTKITFANLKTALNVTGTIVSVGPVTGVPVLTLAGTVHSIRNLTGASGVSIATNANGGITISGAGQTTVEVTGAAYTQTITDDIIYVTVTSTITMFAPATAGNKEVTIRCIAGTTTIAPTSGTVETTTLTVGQSIRLGRRSSGWFNL